MLQEPEARTANRASKTVTKYIPSTKATDSNAGGNSVTFESGSGADHNELTGSYLYNNDVGSKEGARVVTSPGSRFVDRCG